MLLSIYVYALRNKKMKKITIGSDVINKLSERDMADYFERAFNNNHVQDMIRTSSSLSSVKSNFQNFGNILQAYVSSTGDISDEMIEKLVSDFEKHSDKISSRVNSDKLDGAQLYFAEYVMPHIIKHHRPDYDNQQKLSLEETSDILRKIRLNCRNNRFKTHSFNGALLDNVKKNGLNIHREMFKNEYATLENAGLFQPYQKGNLLFCELSKATFGYALYAPERLFMSVCPSEGQKDTQFISEYLSEGLSQRLSEKKLSPEAYQKAFDAGEKMVDFYFGQNKNSGIAFMSDSPNIVTQDKEYCPNELTYAFNDYFFKSKLKDFCDKNNNPSLYESFTAALDEIKNAKKFTKMDVCIKKFDAQYPDSHLFEKPVHNAVIKAVTNSCLNNFTYNGNADGYRIDGGKLDTEEFSVATIPNPVDLYVARQKTEIFIEKQKYMAEEYNRELYQKKYVLALKSGQKPEESFEEYCANNISNIYFLTRDDATGLRYDNPKFRQWKKDRGYLDPKSSASLELDKKIAEKRNKKSQSSILIFDSYQRI